MFALRILRWGVDCRDLPYLDGEIDCVVLDPPYMEGFFRNESSQKAGGGSYSAFRNTMPMAMKNRQTPPSGMTPLRSYTGKPAGKRFGCSGDKAS